MEPTLRLGRIAGIRFGVHWSVLVIWWLLTWSLSTTLLPDAVDGQVTASYWVVGSLTALVLLACLLAHETSHALVARRYGVETEAITLWALGGVAQLQEEPRSPRSEFLVAAAGPATSLGLAATALILEILLAVANAPELVLAAVGWLAVVNLVLAIFNLLPGAPLDGGRVLHAFLWWRSGDRVAATHSASRAGRGLGYALIAIGVLEFTGGYWTGLWLVMVGWFLASSATAEEEMGGVQRVLRDVTVRDVMSPHPESAPDWISVDELLDLYVLRYRHSSFPLRDAHGTLTGLVTLADVKRVPRSARVDTLVGEVATPIDAVPTAEPGEPLLGLMARMASRRRDENRRALVVEHDPLRGERLVGIVTPTDIARAVELGALTSA